MNRTLYGVGMLLAAAGLAAALSLASCGQSNRDTEVQRDVAAMAAQPGTLAYDRGMWQQLLSDHTRIRRVVKFTESGVEATTESDDPAVAGRIIDHAKAMQERVKAGAQVRVWDPVFAELFKRHESVMLEITPTEKGVTILEKSDDPETLMLLRSHALGVNDFVRNGHESGRRETRRLKVGDPVPVSEVAIGGVPHRFLMSQPDGGQVTMLKNAGVSQVVNFRKPAEHANYDEAGAAKAAGMEYCNLPYSGPQELNDELLDQARAAIGDANKIGRSAALHCRTGNRVGPGWASYRVLDQGVPLVQALAEARAIGTHDPLMESKTRDYIRRKSGDGGWATLSPDSMSDAQKATYGRAIGARDAMFQRLFAALGEAMAKPAPEGGPAGAIGVCKEQAPKISQRVAKEHGVMIGRTSAKLRNPMNGAPTWAAGALAATPTEPRVMTNADGSMGVILPIKLSSACLGCHGDPASMDPGVTAALHEKYPKDQATGFKEGDLRGWFWVEVPGK